jgi:hypothetical protein
VWQWCDDITERWGYQPKVTIYPPLPTNKKVRFCVQVELKIMSIQDPRLDTKAQKWRNVEDQSLTAEQVALTMVVEMHRQLDNEELERERAAYAMGAQ